MEVPSRDPEPGAQPRARAGAGVRVGRARARTVATRLGTALREARLGAGLTQHQLSAKAGVSQSRESEIERGRGAGASIETWACLAAAVGEQFVGFLERAPGADRPRDMEHLKRQARSSSLHPWAAGRRCRSLRSILVPARRGASTSLWFGPRWGRPLSSRYGTGSTTSEPACAGSTPSWLGVSTAGSPKAARDAWRVAGCYVVRETRRNREPRRRAETAVRRPIPGSSSAGSRALGPYRAAMPTGTASSGPTQDAY